MNSVDINILVHLIDVIQKINKLKKNEIIANFF